MDREILIYIAMGVLAIISGPILADPRIQKTVDKGHQSKNDETFASNDLVMDATIRIKPHSCAQGGKNG